MTASPALQRLSAENFLSLKDVELTLGPINVLVGPNNAGKSNFLDLVALLGQLVRNDLEPTLQERGGYDRIYFHGDTSGPIRISVKAGVTSHSSITAPDEYRLSLWPMRARIRGSNGHNQIGDRRIIRRHETIVFKRFRGPGRRYTANGARLHMETGSERETLGLGNESLAISLLPRLSKAEGADEVQKIAELFSTFRVFDLDAAMARRPSDIVVADQLNSDGSNLAAFLNWLSQEHEAAFLELVDDARTIIPGLSEVVFEPMAGPSPGMTLLIGEEGLNAPTPLSYVSYGTIRTLATLALLHDPNPPLLTCIEEVDRGLHPYAFDRIIDRVRIASKKTQFLIATHSPALVNRLHPDELVVCERSSDGSSLIPAISHRDIQQIHSAIEGELGLGEIWFSGTLGGVPE